MVSTIDTRQAGAAVGSPHASAAQLHDPMALKAARREAGACHADKAIAGGVIRDDGFRQPSSPCQDEAGSQLVAVSLSEQDKPQSAQPSVEVLIATLRAGVGSAHGRGASTQFVITHTSSASLCPVPNLCRSC